VSCDELVRDLRIARPFLRKILQRLNKKGLLTSYKGKCGGFTLARPASRISVYDIIKAFQGSLSLNECLFLKSACPRKARCTLRKEIDAIERYVVARLHSLAITSLF